MKTKQLKQLQNGEKKLLNYHSVKMQNNQIYFKKFMLMRQ